MTPNDEQLKKLALEEPPSPYRVEVERDGCERCGAGCIWDVVFAPNETAIGITYGDNDEAEEMASDLNGAYRLGWGDRNKDLLRRLEVAERALEIATIEMGDKSHAQTIVDWRRIAETEKEVGK